MSSKGMRFMSMVHLNSDRLDSESWFWCSLFFLSLSFLIWSYQPLEQMLLIPPSYPSCSLSLFSIPHPLFFYFQYMLNHSFPFGLSLWAFKSIKKNSSSNENRFLWAFKCIQMKSHLKIKTETKHTFLIHIILLLSSFAYLIMIKFLKELSILGIDNSS